MKMRTILAALVATVAVCGFLAGCGPAGAGGGAALSHDDGAVPAYKKAGVQEEAASSRSPFVGQKAPDFTLPDQNGKPVSLASLRGQWVVLYFYPKDDTPGCTCEANEFTELLGRLKGMNATVYGVSEDSPQAHQAFIQGFKLAVNLLSDPSHATMRRYGAWVDYYLGDRKFERTIRSTVLIDPDGVIRYHWPEVIPKGHADRVAQRLAILQGKAK